MGQPSETRTLLVILGVVAALGCGCMCVPLALIGVGLGIPAAVQVQKAADRAAAREMPGAPQPFQPVPLPDLAVTPPPVFEPSVETRPAAPPPAIPDLLVPPAFEPPPAFTPPPPPSFAPPSIPKTGSRKKPSSKPPAATGLAALDERGRQFIYRSVTIQRQFQERMATSWQKQRESLRKSGGSTTTLDRIIQDTEQRIETQLDQLCQRHGISRAELEQIITEGDRQGWPGATKAK